MVKTLPPSHQEPVDAETAFKEGRMLEGRFERGNEITPNVVASLDSEDNLKSTDLYLVTKNFYDERGAYIKKGQQVYRTFAKGDQIPDCLRKVEAPKATSRTQADKKALVQEGEPGDRPTRRELEEEREDRLDANAKAIERVQADAAKAPPVDRAAAANPATVAGVKPPERK